MDPGDDYTDTVTHLRIFDEGDGWALDGADDLGHYTPLIWKFDGHEYAVAAMPDFVRALTEEGYKLNWRKHPKRAEARPTRPDEEDYCYTCERVSRWDGEFCTGCGRQWGYPLPPDKEAELTEGDRVIWTDPDGGAQKVGTILSQTDDDAYFVVFEDGSEAGAYAHELWKFEERRWRVTRTEALAVVLDAAWNWANELTEYIAPASEDYDDEESAEVQRSEADQISEAINLLREEAQ